MIRVTKPFKYKLKYFEMNFDLNGIHTIKKHLIGLKSNKNLQSRDHSTNYEPINAAIVFINNIII